MAHETIIYGFIEGTTFTRDEYRKLQHENGNVIANLPDKDEYPYLSKSMFSIPGEGYAQGTFRAQVIHFGSSQKGLEFSDVPLFVQKFENLLKKLYWYQAVLHIEAEIDGSYLYKWTASSEVIETYQTDNPILTAKWERENKHNGE